MNDIDLDFLCGKVLEGIGQCFNGTIHITFKNYVQFLEFAKGNTPTDFIKRNMSLGPNRLLTLELCTFCCYCLCFTFIMENIELIASLWRTIQPKDRNGSRRSCLLNAVSALILHCFHFSTMLASEDIISNL